MVKTLNELSQLRDSGFGQPWPRHGLRLLWWFADECVHIDAYGRMIAQCNPENRDFGFRRFHNRIEDDEDRLLPNNAKLPYYEMGNLSNTNQLPHYVTEYYTGYLDDSNTDRIIVTYDSNCKRFDRIYVTQHSDQMNFDQNHTYRISQGLVKIIKNMSRGEFLKQTKDNQNLHIQLQSRRTGYHLQQTQNQSMTENYCFILCALIFLLVVIFALIK